MKKIGSLMFLAFLLMVLVAATFTDAEAEAKVHDVDLEYATISGLAKDNHSVYRLGEKAFLSADRLTTALEKKDARRHKKRLLKIMETFKKDLEALLKEVGHVTSQTPKCFSERRQEAINEWEGELKTLANELERQIESIEAIQINMISYIDSYCQSRLEECYYKPPVDIRLAEVRLSKSLVRVADKFIVIVGEFIN
jgi:hypothetical protein